MKNLLLEDCRTEIKRKEKKRDRDNTTHSILFYTVRNAFFTCK